MKGREREEGGGDEPDVFVPELLSDEVYDRDRQDTEEGGERPEHELALPEEEHSVLQPVEERRVELSPDRALPDAGERLPGELQGRGLVEPERVVSKVVEPQ